MAKKPILNGETPKENQSPSKTRKRSGPPRKPRILKKVVTDEEGRIVCPKCGASKYSIDDYSSIGEGFIHFVYWCDECGARFAVDKHVRYLGSPYLDRLPEREEEPPEITHAPSPPLNRRRRR